MPGDGAASALVNDDVLQGFTAAQGNGLVDDGLQRQVLAAAQLFISGDDHHRTGPLHTVAHALRAEAAEHHRVDGADARAGLHCGHALDAHAHVDDNAVTLLDPACLHRVGQLAHLGQQFAVADAGDSTVVGLEDDGRLVAQAALDVAIQAVVADVQRAVGKPLVKGRVAAVQHFGEGGPPADEFARQASPISLVVAVGLGDQCVISCHARDPGGCHQAGGRLINRGLGTFAHCWSPALLLGPRKGPVHFAARGRLWRGLGAD